MSFCNPACICYVFLAVSQPITDWDAHVYAHSPSISLLIPQEHDVQCNANTGLQAIHINILELLLYVLQYCSSLLISISHSLAAFLSHSNDSIPVAGHYAYNMTLIDRYCCHVPQRKSVLKETLSDYWSHLPGCWMISVVMLPIKAINEPAEIEI